MNPIEEMMSVLSGLDKNKEILNLWYEVTFLRFYLNQLIMKNSTIGFLEEVEVQICRQEAKKILLEKFPSCGLTFGHENIDEKQKEENNPG